MPLKRTEGSSRRQGRSKPFNALDLSDNPELLAAVVDTVHESLLVLDSELRVVLANRSFFNTFHARAEATLGHPLYEIDNCRWNTPSLKRLVEDVLPKEGSFEGFELSYTAPGSRNRVMELNARRLELGRGRQFLLLAIDDITERKRSNDALLRANAELSSFSYAAAHDLQAPLRIVKSYAGLLAKKYGSRLDAAAAGYIRFIQEGATNMEELIRSLLQYATATEPDPGGKMEIPLKNTIERVLTDLGALIKKEAAEITVGPLPIITAYPVQIRQLFQNLISNAVKYHKPGIAPVIQVAAKESPEEWIFSVRDNGVGIEPQYQDQIFEPLKRLHGREIPGSGLGLATSRKVAERHGGRMWVDSRPGAGSTFYFTIPK